MKTTTTTQPATQPTTLIRNVSFKDANGDRCTAKAELASGRFSMSGEFKGSSGQCFDAVAPATDAQRALLDIWRRWHLNDRCPGTPEQRAALEAGRRSEEPGALSSYDQQCFFLAAQGLLEVPHPDGETITETDKDTGKQREIPKPYRYGTDWLTEPLPDDFADTLADTIDEIEEENADPPATADALPGLDEEGLDQAAPILALAIMLGAPLSSVREAEVSSYDDRIITFEGADYLVGTDEEMNEKWEEALDSYLDECVMPELSGDLARYFDRNAWKSDARLDGRAHALNHYDGNELSADLDGETYFAYRQ